MKRIYVLAIMLAASTLFTMVGCKKSSTDDTDLSTEIVTTQTEDQSRFSGEDDAVSDDVNTVLESDPLFGGRTMRNLPCNATATDSTGAIYKSLTITYNGRNCDSTRTRTGTVTFKMLKNKKWKDAGTEITVNITNLKITRLSDNKSITLNGEKKLTNVTGHLLLELPTLGSSIKHTITSSNMSATFDNGTSRNWSIAKQREFSFSGGLVLSITGTGTVSGVSNVVVWGTNRLGQDFATRITSPLVIRQDCQFRLTSGKIEHTRMARDITVTYGLDASGNATSCPGSGSYYFKAEWTSAGGTPHSIIKPY